MSDIALVDTGPLVALLSLRDAHHRWTVDMFAAERGRLVTCEAVLAETCFLLKRAAPAVDAVMSRVADGTLGVESLAEDGANLRRLMHKYADVPMSYADACIVRLVEKLPRVRVITLDRDFRIYRSHGRRQIPLVAPFGY